jgi:glycosyltransferase involved in cell wall biosynthesis
MTVETAKNEFKVSVIIPVYNAEKYLLRSVKSVISLKEVGEIILIEDNSPDNALELCEQLCRDNEMIKLYTHPNNENKGAAASRNLGIEMANFDFISFLDADDWYLPNRFKAEKELFKNNDIDAVYGATGFYKEGEGFLNGKLTTLQDNSKKPESLLFRLLNMEGKFHTNAITIRKKLILKSGNFNNSLRLHQDTHLWYRLAHFGNLQPGITANPVAIRRVHSENRIQHKSLKTRGLMHIAVFEDFKDYRNVDSDSMRIIINRYVHAISKNIFHKIYNYLRLILSKPRLLKYYL